MSRGTKILLALPVITLAALLLCMIAWLARSPGTAGEAGPAEAPATSPASAPPLRLGLIPEHDIFHLRRKYKALADYLSVRLGRPVELATANSYETILLDFQEKKIDAAFMGSLVAVMAMDRSGARPIARPVTGDGTTAYKGVLFTRSDSSVRELSDLKGRSIAMVRTTSAGNLFPVCSLMRLGVWETARPVWVGTHDDVASAVMDGTADSGAIKDHRLEAMLAKRPGWKVRVLAESREFPENGLLLRADVEEEYARKLSKCLLEMHLDPNGREVVKAMGLEKFLPCSPSDYQSVYEMVDCIGAGWKDSGIAGPPPKLPAGIVSRKRNCWCVPSQSHPVKEHAAP